MVRPQAPGTVQDAGSCNRATTTWLVGARSRDSPARLEQHPQLGDTLAALLQTCAGAGAIGGTPSPELLAQLKDSPVQVDTPFLAT